MVATAPIAPKQTCVALRWISPAASCRVQDGAMHGLFWKFLALLFGMLAAAGAALPVLPMIPFLLLAVAAGSRGWPQFVDRLAADPRYGSLVSDWRDRGVLPR